MLLGVGLLFIVANDRGLGGGAGGGDERCWGDADAVVVRTRVWMRMT